MPWFLVTQKFDAWQVFRATIEADDENEAYAKAAHHTDWADVEIESFDHNETVRAL